MDLLMTLLLFLPFARNMMFGCILMDAGLDSLSLIMNLNKLCSRESIYLTLSVSTCIRDSELPNNVLS